MKRWQLSRQAACNILTGASSSNDFKAEVQELNKPQKSDESTSVIPLPTTSKPVQSSISTKETTSMPSISPIISGSSGTINFTVNICPSGPISVGHTATDQYQDLLKDIDFTEFFSTD